MTKQFLPVPLLILLSLNIAHASGIAAFSSPENSFAALQKFLSEAKGSIYVAVYTIDSPFVMDELLNAGPDITLIAEKSPVGGISQQENNILCNLQRKNISVYLYDGSGYMHAKYMVSGSTVLVSTENLGSSGFPKNGYGNRGYGAIVYDEGIAGEFLSVFKNDLNLSKEFACENRGEIIYEKIASYQPPELKIYRNQNVTAVFAPGAIDDVVGLINSSKERLYIEQFYIYRNWGSKKNPTKNLFLETAIGKAREGADVKILLDSTYYNIDKNDTNSNYYTTEYVNEVAKQGLSLEARLIDLNKVGIEKIHAKMFVVDSTAVISSINWNEHSPLRNREAGIAVTGEAAEYYADAFMSDWSAKAFADKTTGKAAAQRHDWITAIAIMVLIVIIILVLSRRKSKQL